MIKELLRITTPQEMRPRTSRAETEVDGMTNKRVQSAVVVPWFISSSPTRRLQASILSVCVNKHVTSCRWSRSSVSCHLISSLQSTCICLALSAYWRSILGHQTFCSIFL